MSAPTLPVRSVTDGGLETDLIFHHGVKLPDFAAFVLLDDDDGRRTLREYYLGYVEIARAHHAALRLETPTWRASADWGTRLGYDADALRRVNADAVRLLQQIAAESDLPTVRIVGMIGPRGDGYRSGAWDPETGPDDAYRYHRDQIRALADAGADVIAAYTLNDAAEARGVVRAAREAGVEVEVSFTVETDGLLASGLTLAATVAEVDAAEAPDGYLLNCAHPDHFDRALDAATAQRIVGIRPNASRLSHAELDDSETLDDGDPVELAERVTTLLRRMPSVRVIGGCCGTDSRHIAAMWERLAADSGRA
ncbi:homocysteine S-methyltransferase family protein [Microbacterium sp. UFMG61]|uniref:homocysteine S-methyltransferase family protein n=1 Tax=Microbacterium sp. UFMG61 TaxID=2745935 RepID=UPI00188F4FF3|nr:homocysteine S-methyltransferase family protein [Microbacterium sp. UFMG61]